MTRDRDVAVATREPRPSTRRRYERPVAGTCRGRIDAHVKDLVKQWKRARDTWERDQLRDCSIYNMRWAARELLKALGG